MASGVRIADGSLDFSLGMDSGRVTTIQGPNNPLGLPRNMLAWLDNATVRNGCISQRTGWLKRVTVHDRSAVYQGGLLYTPDFANPYLMLSIGGRIYQVRVDLPTYDVKDVTGTNANPATPQVWMCQAESFLVLQAGDLANNPNPTKPLFWDGTTLRRSLGIIGPNNTPGNATPYNELPAGTAMVYYGGRLWYAQGRQFIAGDIVQNLASGTAAYQYRDSVLKVTENPLATGGDGFIVPTAAGNITGLAYSGSVDTTYGQGPLYVFTRRQVYQMVIPVTRASWIASGATLSTSGGVVLGAANTPQQTLAQPRWGATSDRAIVSVNADLFYTSLEPGIRSLFLATRFFSQWGNVNISRNLQRVLDVTDRSLLQFATGIEFDNRLLMGLMPYQTPVGAAFQCVGALDFDIISNLGDYVGSEQRPPPAWEGIWEGLDILQLFEGDFGGLQRAFAVVHSRDNDAIEVWELTNYSQRDNVDSRVTWVVETPAYNWGKEFDLKRLDGGEVWLDDVAGTVQVTVEYKVDADSCWNFWHAYEFCAARSACENASQPVCYPTPPALCPGQKFPLVLPKPPPPKNVAMDFRPADIGYQFQVRLTITGFCRVRGWVLYGIMVDRRPFEGLQNMRP